MSKKIVPIVKTSIEKMEIEFPLYSYYEADDWENRIDENLKGIVYDREYGIYVKVDENLRATFFIVEYRGQWTSDDEADNIEVSYKIKVIPHYYPNETEIANRITREQFLDGIGQLRREFWKMYLDFLVKDYGK